MEAIISRASEVRSADSPLYGDSERRVFWFPKTFLARVEDRPGALIELLTVLLSEHIEQEQPVPITAVKPMHQRSSRAQSYRRTKEKNSLRPELMRENPHCCVCDLRLQDIDSTKPNFACVHHHDRVLTCRTCVTKR